MKNIAIYPGTFDPITNGHLDVIRRASKIFSHLIIGVANNYEKHPLFTAEERKTLIQKVLNANSIYNTEVITFSSLLVHFATSHNANFIIRGLRAVSDFEYEFQMACVNKKLNDKIETIFLPSSEEMHFVSSRFVKSIAVLKGDVSKFISPVILDDVNKKFQ